MHARAVNRKQKDKVSSRYLVSHVVPLNCHAYAPQHSFEKQPQPDLNRCLQAENLTSWAGLDDGALRPPNPADYRPTNEGCMFFSTQPL